MTAARFDANHVELTSNYLWIPERKTSFSTLKTSMRLNMQIVWGLDNLNVWGDTRLDEGLQHHRVPL